MATGGVTGEAGEVERALDASLAVLRGRIDPGPSVGVVLGSGLGAFADALDARVVVPYAEIPGMPSANVPGHAGVLVAGRSAGMTVPVRVLQGRSHLYEGHAPQAVVHGVRLLAKLGARAVILTNSAGIVRTDLRSGTLMLIEDQLNLTGQNPLAGHPSGSGVRFVDMGHAYDPALRAVARQVASAQGTPLALGVYAGVLGPSYETPAEVRMLRALGADAVGMSTVLEAIALRQLGIRVVGISCLTNVAGADATVSHADVARVAEQIGPKLVALLTGLAAAIWQKEPAA